MVLPHHPKVDDSGWKIDDRKRKKVEVLQLALASLAAHAHTRRYAGGNNCRATKHRSCSPAPFALPSSTALLRIVRSSLSRSLCACAAFPCSAAAAARSNCPRASPDRRSAPNLVLSSLPTRALPPSLVPVCRACRRTRRRGRSATRPPRTHQPSSAPTARGQHCGEERGQRGQVWHGCEEGAGSLRSCSLSSFFLLPALLFFFFSFLVFVPVASFASAPAPLQHPRSPRCRSHSPLPRMPLPNEIHRRRQPLREAVHQH